MSPSSPNLRLTKSLDVLLVGAAAPLAAGLMQATGGSCRTAMCADLADATAEVALHRYDAVVAGVDEAILADVETLQALIAASAMTPVLVVTDPGCALQHEQLLRLGVQDCLFREEVTAAHLIRSALYAIERKGLENRLKGTLAELAVANASLRRLSTRDPLTGALNRRAFCAALDRALARCERRQQRVAVLYFDLDGFKQVNDRLGHAAGDRLLVGFCRRVRPFLRRSDQLARLGGDEYAAVIEDVATARDAVAAANRIRAALERPMQIEGHTVQPRASIGIALGRPGSTAAVVLRQADAAMYIAKREGTGAALFGQALEQEQRTRERLLADLPAYHSRDMDVQYRSIVDRHGRPAWLEAMLVWQHPILGRVPAEQFLDLASGETLRALLGVVLDRAAAHGRARAVGAGIWVAVPPAALHDPELARMIAARARNPGSPTVCIGFCERAVLRDPEAAIGALQDLGRAGATRALDGLGAGALPLALLQRLPIEMARLAGTVVPGLSADAALRRRCQALVGYAQALGVGVLAPLVAPEWGSAAAGIDCELTYADTAGASAAAGPALPWVEPDIRRWHAHTPRWRRRLRRQGRASSALVQ
jgi:diguanylate cyclase (GGDEF)-like protein